jgi:hypothetical protein
MLAVSRKRMGEEACSDSLKKKIDHGMASIKAEYDIALFWCDSDFLSIRWQ